MNVKEAIRKAFTYMEELKEFLPSKNPQLEKFSQEGNYWYITISVEDPTRRSPIAALSGFDENSRTARTFKIDDESGKVIEMQMAS